VPRAAGGGGSTVASGFESPVLLTGAGDGSGDRYVVEQRGLVLRLGADGVADGEPFLDIRDRVLHHHERGLLGLAFHPDFERNGRLYALYSQTVGDGATSISEFTSGGDGSVEDSERQLLTIPSFSTMHKGGMLAFDAAGMLLAGIGDGSTGNDPEGNGQDAASLLGALLRLDVDRGYPYAIPPDNGFAGDREARGEIHAIGLRNPWRFSVDGETGHAYIGDVGQSDWEEIDVLAPGAREPSFGWSVMEGNECFYGRDCDPAEHIAPAIAYPHVDGEVGHCSVIGGYVYRGQAGTLPQDTYLYADFCSGTIWAARGAELRAGQAEPVVVGRVPADLGQPQSFGIDDDGELYLVTSAGYVLGIGAAS
jgi:glucose/arabinose dehydrogenase